MPHGPPTSPGSRSNIHPVHSIPCRPTRHQQISTSKSNCSVLRSACWAVPRGGATGSDWPQQGCTASARKRETLTKSGQNNRCREAMAQRLRGGVRYQWGVPERELPKTYLGMQQLSRVQPLCIAMNHHMSFHLALLLPGTRVVMPVSLVSPGGC